MNFNGTNWVNVGNAGFSLDIAEYTSLAFDQSGKICLAYWDYRYDGAATVMKYDSVLVGICEQQESKFSLYPNPAFDQITIETSAIPEQSQLTISNINNQQLITRQITAPKTQLDISSLSSGVYFVRLTSEKTVVTGKFIKQ